MDGVSLLKPGTLDAARRIFGVSDVKPFAGPSGFRTLLDSGPPNYGVASVMMVSGNQWFEISLISGELTAGRVHGHSETSVQAMSEAEARRYLMEQIRRAGFEIEQAETTGLPQVDTR
jgi:hypothetical protein